MNNIFVAPPLTRHANDNGEKMSPTILFKAAILADDTELAASIHANGIDLKDVLEDEEFTELLWGDAPRGNKARSETRLYLNSLIPKL